MQFRDLKAQYRALKPQIDQAIQTVLDEGHFIMGRQVTELEERLSRYTGVKHCIDDNIRIGMNSRLDTIQAAILLVKLQAFIDYELEQVNGIAARYTDLLKDVVKTPVIPAGYYSSWAQYTIQLGDSEQRGLVQHRLNEDGIPTMIYYHKPMHNQTAFAYLN